MLLYVYLGLVLFLLVFVIKNMVREKNLMLQIDAASGGNRRRHGGLCAGGGAGGGLHAGAGGHPPQ